ncbi:MAG TPA: type II toxin-antitoxin system PemK/MazF family toxin [Terracidiphilus sp.]
MYRVSKVPGDPKKHRVVVIVSRQALIDSQFSTVVCAPVLTEGQGLSTQVSTGPESGLKHHSWILCDGITSVRKAELTQYVGSLPSSKLFDLDRALAMALDLHI